jgi:hypothetical protein
LVCHSDIAAQETLNSAYDEAHKEMLEFTPGNDTRSKCLYCHQDVDLLQHSAGNLRKNVAVEVCDVCHGPNGPGKQFYQE